MKSGTVLCCCLVTTTYQGTKALKMIPLYPKESLDQVMNSTDELIYCYPFHERFFGGKMRDIVACMGQKQAGRYFSYIMLMGVFDAKNNYPVVLSGMLEEECNISTQVNCEGDAKLQKAVINLKKKFGSKRVDNISSQCYTWSMLQIKSIPYDKLFPRSLN